MRIGAVWAIGIRAPEKTKQIAAQECVITRVRELVSRGIRGARNIPSHRKTHIKRAAAVLFCENDKWLKINVAIISTLFGQSFSRRCF